RNVSGKSPVHIRGDGAGTGDVESRVFRHGGNIEADAEIMRRGLVIHTRVLVADESALPDSRVFAGPDVLLRQRFVERGKKLRLRDGPRWIKLSKRDFGNAAVLGESSLEAEKREAEEGQRLEQAASHQDISVIREIKSLIKSGMARRIVNHRGD